MIKIIGIKVQTRVRTLNLSKPRKENFDKNRKNKVFGKKQPKKFSMVRRHDNKKKLTDLL